MLQKEIKLDGTTTLITLSDEEIKLLEEESDFYKLNNLNEECFVEGLSLRFNHWKDVAQDIFRRRPKPELKIGIEGTVNYYSDRRAVTVVKVFTPKKIAVQFNKTKCLDYYNSKYKIYKELEKKAPVIYTQRKNGGWVQIGQPNKRGSVTLTLGYQEHYIDPTF